MAPVLNTCTGMSEVEVQEAFLAAPPLLASTILDLTVKSPNFLMDVPEYQVWPEGNGTRMDQLVFKGAMPQIERGFDAWTSQTNNTGCDPCEGPNCGYNWTGFGGTAMERKAMDLMSRDFKSPGYCIKMIQTTAHFDQVFNKIVENLYRQTAFFKEQNIAFNLLQMFTKKYVVDSEGPKPNNENPYVYRAAGTATLGTLNMLLLEFFYEYMRRMPDVIPYDVVDGAPIYAMLVSNQMLSHMYRDDPQLRQDARFSGVANDLLMKYNFISSIRGMFIPAPILYPRRFYLEETTGEPIEVLPFVNGVPGEVGVYTSFNPDYESLTTHEEVILHGKHPFTLWTQPTLESLGNGTSFGPEFSFMQNWMWVNPMTIPDPFRRVGFFATSATLGVSPQFSEGMFAILLTRPHKKLTAVFQSEPLCPPTPVDCDNTVPAVGCPCPLILSSFANPTVEGNFFINVSVPLDVAAEDTVQFGINTGGYLTGEVVTISEDGKSVEVTFTEGLDYLGLCDRFTSIFCDDTLGCYADVIDWMVNCLDATRIDVVLSNPIKAVTAADVVTVYFGDGTSDESVTVVSVDMTTNTWVLDLGATAFCNTVGGITAVCVPTATDATCPGCAGITITQCET